uniref:U6 snRNA phosphodiesterase 1 n=1 Tax=Oncorhynchus tshawytscha TaxID=74940 RepID=A0A8C8H814_ONCTS
MLVSYSNSSEEEIENVLLEDVTKRLRYWHRDDNSLRKKHKSEEHTTKTRLPLPGSVLDMFTEEDDDPQTGQHTTWGNWTTYVYFPHKYIPEEGFLELLDEMTKVSKTVVLRHHWIQPFIQSLRTDLAHGRMLISLAEKLKVYSNDDTTRYRHVLAMEVATGQAQLLELMKAVDGTMEEFTLDTFYKNPSFHVSLTWCVGDCTEHIRKECLQELQGLVDSHEDGAFLLRLDCQELQR